jgi:TetR/AcrR family transcriptional regulator, transcriptional repressor for nem operon
MTTRTDTRAQILEIGGELISKGGFQATGIDAVLKKAGVPKGSFYHYFPSKDDFGLAVIDLFAEEGSRRLAGFLDDGGVPPLDRIRKYFASVISHLQNEECKRGCLIGTLGQELAGHSEKFRLRIEKVFEDWKQQFANCLTEAQVAGELAKDADPNELAGFLLAGIEGAILRAKVSKSVRPIRELEHVFFERVIR